MYNEAQITSPLGIKFMMLAGSGFFIIEHILPHLEHSKNNMLGIARMSMNWRIDQILAVLKAKKIPYSNKYAEAIRASDNNYTSRDFFKLLRFINYDDLDFDGKEGCNIIHDLNQPLPEQHHRKYDFVFENGTIEHVFDIKQAISNIAQTTKVGGYVLHISPLDAFNHGFYNLSINFFADFYRANGFTDFIIFMLRSSSEWYKGTQDVMAEQISYTHEEFYIKPETYQSKLNKFSIAFFAKKQEHCAIIKTPTQAAYDKSLQLPSRLNNW